MKRNIIFFTLLFLSISACEKEIKMDIPDNERKLVVNGVFNAGEPIVLTVSLSMSMLEKSQIESVNNAEIKLFENGIWVKNLDTFSQLWSDRTTYYSKDFIVAADKTYKMVVSAPGIDKMASVEIKVPTHVPIVKIDTATVKTDENNEMFQFDMLINDPQKEENFYQIYLQSKSLIDQTNPKDPHLSIGGETSICIETDDVLINNDNFLCENGLIFNDISFNGKLRNIKFKTNAMRGDTTNYQVLLRSISVDYYNYLVSSILYKSSLNGNNVGISFTEPVSVKSNVKDGFGIVTAVNQSIDSSIIYIRP